jgi:DNA-directed RNA polymerase I, II, and III subunit RPABC5
MIIPIRCFTCGKLIANLWDKYQNELQSQLDKLKETYQDELDQEKIQSIEHQILDKMELTRYCCRRMMISHVDLCDKI